MFGLAYLAVAHDTYREYKERGTLKEFADHFGMNGREFAEHQAINRDVTFLTPLVQVAYACAHNVTPSGPWCPTCGAAMVAWQ